MRCTVISDPRSFGKPSSMRRPVDQLLIGKLCSWGRSVGRVERLSEAMQGRCCLGAKLTPTAGVPGHGGTHFEAPDRCQALDTVPFCRDLRPTSITRALRMQTFLATQSQSWAERL